MITLLDYGAGNVKSVINAIQSLGESVKVVQSGNDILKAEKLVFPGVGSFGNMMDILNVQGWKGPLLEYLHLDRPFLGICLGLQALFDYSEESPGKTGLGFIPGHVERFSTRSPVPHIGWNGIKAKQPSKLFEKLSGEEKFYFVHSYHVVPESSECILTTTDYEQEFVSGVQKSNVLAIQFHPEKSGQAGLSILESFLGEKSSVALPSKSSSKTELAKRIISCLDVRSNDQGDLVVTKGDQYDVREQGDVRNLGKPVELAERYYQEGADEITFLNITGFRDFPLQDLPMLQILQNTSQNVFVPLTIGGGIQDYTDKNGIQYSALEVASKYFRFGADKVSIGSDAVLIVEKYLASGEKPGNSAIEEISRVYGSQAVVISIDPVRIYVSHPESVKHETIKTAKPGPEGEEFCWYQCTIKGGREGRNLDAITMARACEELGSGEILLNCIDRDGTNSGFDLELIRALGKAVSIPVIASSGAGSAEHFREVFTETPARAALAAGIFHRREVPIQEVKIYLNKQVEIRK